MIINGDAHKVAQRFESESIDFVISSPPYYSPIQGLREYKPDCIITWPDGWTGMLGNEPTPQAYIAHSLLIYKEIFRLLKPHGTFALNIGDTRAGSGRGPSGKNALVKNQEQRQGFVGTQQKIPPGFKRKDMFGVPFRMGIALQEIGFTWRDCIPWIKRNGAIGSYTDRPVSSIEWILILSKSEHNYYDYIGVMQQASESYNKDKRPRGVLRQRVNANTRYDRSESQYKKQDDTGNPTHTGLNARFAESGSCYKRFLKSSDFFFKTWQGLWCDEEGQPLALIINPKNSHSYKHTASFPVLLPQTLIEAYTSPEICNACGKPKIREAHKEHSEDGSTYQIITDGWKPTCSCGTGFGSAIVMDPFNGVASTGIACKNTKRNYIGIEISKEYTEWSQERMRDGK
jgi:DNA modification methylase